MKIQNPRLFSFHANLCGVLANPKRLMIIALVSKKEMSVSELAEAIDASLATTSQHLRILRENNVVLSRKDGQTVYYRLADIRIMQACTTIRTVLLDNMKSAGKVAQELDPAGTVDE